MRLGRKAVTRGSVRRFAIHYVEMLAAMGVGMLVLGMGAEALLGWLDVEPVAEGTVAETMWMATTMSVGMAVWMRYRHHSWSSTAEMCAAMYVSFAVLYPPFWAGLLSGDGVMMIGHTLMFPAMLLVMLRRWDEYSAGHRAHENSLVHS